MLAALNLPYLALSEQCGMTLAPMQQFFEGRNCGGCAHASRSGVNATKIASSGL
jgi:hypothetical protein